ncbi:ABC transporter permease [Tolypothrix sp. PCC 7910]|uniref:ABC transporter permease n=1 Tax=Tolypothrix sp. PCC 7910 TaxID=2099387 RepID=UPI0014276ECD|nr:ABC transporter permease [Tolypothrix sp. PCC 7910]QIR39713.1 ABC transporter permease [Tolypothrix sp. PCC 7910]
MKSFGLSRSHSQLGQKFDVLRQLVERDMKLLYKRSVLGVAWTLINPLLQLVVFAFVFQVILPAGIPRYASFTFTGLLVWNWFSSSLYQATGVIIANRPLIRQPGFPLAILPIVTTTTGLIHFLLALPVLIIFLLVDGIQLKTVVLFLPILQALQFLLTVCLAYLLAALNVSLRDTQHTLGVILQLLFYVTPIFYDIKNVPPTFHFFYNLNPMVHIISAYRAVLIQGTQPDWQSLGIIAIIMSICLPIGLKFFQRQSDRFVEEI